jgi:hypothetical protein
VLQVHKYGENHKFVLACPKELGKNKIYKIEATETQVILAKDSGVVEVRSADSGKVLQTFQQQAQNQTLSKAMLDYTYARLSADQQLIALQDKEKSLQIREVRSVGTLLARASLPEHLSAFTFTSDNQYLLCASSNSKDQGGGGLVYIFKVEHNQAMARASVVRQQ